MWEEVQSHVACFKCSLVSVAIATPQNTENPTFIDSVKEGKFTRVVQSVA